MNKLTILSIFCSLLVTFGCKENSPKNQFPLSLDNKVDSVLNSLTLDEKIGQLNQVMADFSTALDTVKGINIAQEVRMGRVGSICNSLGLDSKIELQKIAVEQSRSKIPLLFALDVVHGYQTIFPIPLGASASFDISEIERGAQMQAEEMSADGIMWTFAPMVDISRDARWGRCMEGAGEDTWWATQVGAAQIRGFQGKDYSKPNTVLACAKHFAAYGTVEGGREYNVTDISEIVMREVYLPPFKAAVDEGCATFMDAFTTFNRIPATCNNQLNNEILKKEWGFKGIVISDANSVTELMNHNIAADTAQAAELAINAGCDVDLAGYSYITKLKILVNSGKVAESVINESVKRLLQLKFAMGLFDNPYRYFEKVRRDTTMLNARFKQASLDMARKSLVLLKNENNLLPIKKDIKKLAIIGQLANSHENNDYIGNWAAIGKSTEAINLLEGIKAKVSPETQLLYAEGGNAYGNCPPNMIAKAVEAARKADVVVIAMGENGYMSGECASRTDIGLPNNMEELVRAVVATGKPVVAVLFTGRPLAIKWVAEIIPSILCAWHPGTMGGTAISDALFGDYNPQGKLPITFPQNVGQVPIYYNQFNTSRAPIDEADKRWGVTGWSDVSRKPLWPFGFGLSYSNFEYGKLKIDKDTIGLTDTLSISVEIKNTTPIVGTETVQLYIRDLVGEVIRPLKELKGVKKLTIAGNQSKTATFKLTAKQLEYVHSNFQYSVEPGTFEVMVGTNSQSVQKVKFHLK